LSHIAIICKSFSILKFLSNNESLSVTTLNFHNFVSWNIHQLIGNKHGVGLNNGLVEENIRLI